jgi:hypothetical protein
MEIHLSAIHVYLPICILLCGVLGPAAVHFGNLEKDEKPISWNLVGDIFYGIVAAFMTPIFLNTITSDIMNKIFTYATSSNTSEIAVFRVNFYLLIGFSLIASVSSKYFIQKLTVKIIKSEETDKEKETLEAKLDAQRSIMEKNNISTNINMNKLNLKDVEKLLIEIVEAPEAVLSQEELQMKIPNLGTNVIKDHLNQLVKDNKINEIKKGGKTTYGVSKSGVDEYKTLL